MSKEIHDGPHTCKRCKEDFHQSMFHVGAGLCDDCYDIVAAEEDDQPSPIQQQINADAATIKRLEANVYSLKQMFEVAGQKNKALSDENERLILERDLAQGMNGEIVKENEELRDALKTILDARIYIQWREKYRKLINKIYGL